MATPGGSKAADLFPEEGDTGVAGLRAFHKGEPPADEEGVYERLNRCVEVTSLPLPTESEGSRYSHPS